MDQWLEDTCKELQNMARSLFYTAQSQVIKKKIHADRLMKAAELIQSVQEEIDPEMDNLLADVTKILADDQKELENRYKPKPKPVPMKPETKKHFGDIVKGLTESLEEKKRYVVRCHKHGVTQETTASSKEQAISHVAVNYARSKNIKREYYGRVISDFKKHAKVDEI